MNKQKLTELIQQYKKENDIDTLQLDDMFYELPTLAHFIEQKVADTDFVLSFDSVQGESDSYCMCTTYSMSMGKPIIVNWYTRTHYENEIELIDTLLTLNNEAVELLARIK